MTFRAVLIISMGLPSAFVAFLGFNVLIILFMSPTVAFEKSKDYKIIYKIVCKISSFH